MPHELEGQLRPPSTRVAIVVSRYNETVTRRLLDAALATLGSQGVADDAIDVAWVPGSFELPLVADRMARSQRYAAVLCLGAVIRGETTHDQHVNRAISLQIMESGIASGVPVLFGVLTCDTLEQALQRAGGRHGNKGSECAEAALRMADLLGHLPS